MDRLGDVHLAFLRECAAKPRSTHLSDLPVEELQQMVDERLLIKYSTRGGSYAITPGGSQFVKTLGASPELKKIAVDFVKSKGFNEEEAIRVVEEHGAERVLKAQDPGATGQREIVIPTNEQGKPEIKARKS